MTMQIKRRLTGAVGAPSTLKSGQLAWSLLDQTLYIGDGDNGSGDATNIRPIGGDGLYATKAYVLTVRLDQLAAPTAAIPLNGQRITGLADPINPQDASTKAYVDAARSGLDLKDSVAVATTANIALSGLQTIDGYTTVAGDRVLVKSNTTASQNGIWIAAAGSWTRATDADANAEVTTGLFVFVERGTLGAATSWALNTTGAIVVGTTALTFVQVSGAGTFAAGNGLNLAGTTFTVVSANTGRIVVSGSGVDLASGIVAASTYRSVSVDTYGRVTGGSNPTTLAGYAITDAQGLNVNLTGIAGLTSAADRLPYFTGGAGASALAVLTAQGRALIDDADAPAQRTTLGLGTMATQAASGIAVTGGSMAGVAMSSTNTFDDGTY